jgi:uncharacterized membrane protein YhiD involved in acid resistance
LSSVPATEPVTGQNQQEDKRSERHRQSWNSGINFIAAGAGTRRKTNMAFFTSAVGVLQTLVIALGAGLGIWGAVNLMEGYGNDNRATRS